MSYNIAGTVLNVEAQPIEGVPIIITEHDNEVTDSQGQFSATVSGTVTVTPEIEGFVFTPISRTTSSENLSMDFEGRDMRYYEYKEASFGVSDIGWSYEISGLVTDYDGNPLEGATVNFDWPGWSSCPLTPVYTQSDGTFLKTHCYGNGVKVSCYAETEWPGPKEPIHVFDPEYHTVSGADSNVNFQSTTEPPDITEKTIVEPQESTFGVEGIEWQEIPPVEFEKEETIAGATFGVEGIEWQEILPVEFEKEETIAGATFGVENIEWQFIVTAPPYEVTGTVKDLNGNPVQDVEMQFRRTADNHFYDPVYTDEHGEYLKFELHHEVEVTANLENYSFAPEGILVDGYISGINFDGEYTGFPPYHIWASGGTLVFYLQDLTSVSPVGSITYNDLHFKTLVSAKGYKEKRLFGWLTDEAGSSIPLFGKPDGEDSGEEPNWIYYTPPFDLREAIVRRLEVEADGPINVKLFYPIEMKEEEVVFNPEEKIMVKNLAGHRAEEVVLIIEGAYTTTLEWLRLSIIPIQVEGRTFGSEE